MPHTSKRSVLLFQPLGWLNTMLQQRILICCVKVLLQNDGLEESTKSLNVQSVTVSASETKKKKEKKD